MPKISFEVTQAFLDRVAEMARDSLESDVDGFVQKHVVELAKQRVTEVFPHVFNAEVVKLVGEKLTAPEVADRIKEEAEKYARSEGFINAVFYDLRGELDSVAIEAVLNKADDMGVYDKARAYAVRAFKNAWNRKMKAALVPAKEVAKNG